ncbi:MAG: xylulokinase [Planctomycetota bacterium]|jgi:xylulokinase
MGTRLIGIDVGTSACKVVLVDERGAVVAVTSAGYPLSTPRPQWSEQDPNDWWRGACSAITEVLQTSGTKPGEVGAIGLTGQMHGLVALGADGQPLRPAMLWNDQRTGAQCAAIHDRLGESNMIAITGKPALPSFTAPKLLWIAEHEPEVYERIRSIMLPKDYVRFRLTGQRCTDVADGSGTSLIDLGTRTWSPEILAALGVLPEWLPTVHESPDVCATIDADGAAATGLLEGTPIVAGAGDQAAEAIGCGLDREGSASVAIGTSGVVFAPTDAPRIDGAGRLHAYCHAVPGRWHVMAVMLSAGGSLRWYRDTVAAGLGGPLDEADAYDVITAAAQAAPIGCEGLSFLPYLTGERAPHPDPDARGAYVGLTLRHGSAHLARATFEGITFGLRDCLDLCCPDPASRPMRLRISGGGARSPWWRQMLADVFEAEVATVNVSEGAAYGAALLASVGAGVFEDVPTACTTAVRETGVTSPDAAASAAYQPALAQYRALYPALRGAR